jgi:lysozyme family protein
MADLQVVFPLTKTHEGGWQQDPNDAGNEGAPLGTYCGATQKNFPKLPIWAFLTTQTYVYGKIFPELTQDMIDFYRADFWNPIRGDEINDVTEAAETFDMAVLKGVPTAIQLTQAAAGVPQTGVMDDATIEALNNPTI